MKRPIGASRIINMMPFDVSGSNIPYHMLSGAIAYQMVRLDYKPYERILPRASLNPDFVFV